MGIYKRYANWREEDYRREIQRLIEYQQSLAKHGFFDELAAARIDELQEQLTTSKPTRCC